MRALVAAVSCFFLAVPNFASVLCGSTMASTSAPGLTQKPAAKSSPPCHREAPAPKGPKLQKAAENSCPLCRSGICEDETLFSMTTAFSVKKELSGLFALARSSQEHSRAFLLANLNRGPPGSFVTDPPIPVPAAGWQALFSIFLL